MDAAPYDPSYEEHGILGALKLRVGGLFGSTAAPATPAAIDSSYDQFNAASLLSQENVAADPENPSGPAGSPTGTGEVPRGEEQVHASTATTALEADEPGAEANEVVRDELALALAAIAGGEVSGRIANARVTAATAGLRARPCPRRHFRPWPGPAVRACVDSARWLPRRRRRRRRLRG